MDIAGSRVLVTGGARRLGRALALGLAGRGAQVAFTYHRSAGDAQATTAALVAADAGGHAIAADLADGHAAIEAVAAAASVLGGLDVLVHAASGGFVPIDPMDVDPALFADALGATLTGGFFCAQAARRAMGEKGVVVFVTDVAVLEAWPHFAPHAAAKAGLAQLTRSLARGFAPGVRVCAVAPGPVLLPEGSDEAVAQRQAGRTALGRLGAPEDVVGAVAYLIQADYVTGEQLVVDGGHAL
ncbi:MAG: pteridine reductase [Gaiellales bacterium]|jgi:pteridine reductase|nr:pteridine reductase [Gaiellales bacterium]